MATHKRTSEDLRRIQELAHGWGKIIVQRHWGENGPGLDVDLAQMEDVAMAAVQALLAGTLEAATQQQAVQLGSEHACPECKHLCPLRHKERPIVAQDRQHLPARRTEGALPGLPPGFFSLNVRS